MSSLWNAGGAFNVWRSCIIMNRELAGALKWWSLLIGLMFVVMGTPLLYPHGWEFTKTYLHALFLSGSPCTYHETYSSANYPFSTGDSFMRFNGHLWAAKYKTREIGLSGGLFMFGFIGTYALAFIKFMRMHDKQRKPRFLEGTEIISIKQLTKDMRKQGVALGARVGTTRQPRDAEYQGTIIVGAARSGKTLLLLAIVVDLMARASKGLIYGWRPDEYFSKNFMPGRDLLFCPVDARTIRWNFFKEITDPVSDIPKFAACLVQNPPDSGTNSWVYVDAQEIMSGIILYCYVHYGSDMSTIMQRFWEMLCLSSAELAKKLKQQPGCEVAVQLLVETKTGTGAQIRLSELKKQTKFFQYCQNWNDNFSIQQWLSDGKPGFIFTQNRSKSAELISGILTLFIDVFARAVADLPTDRDNRIFVLVDEAGTLGKTQSVADLATRGGAKGISLYIASQDLAQLTAIFGKTGLISIDNSTASKIILRNPNSETARKMSDWIGKQKVIEISGNTTGDTGSNTGNRQSENEHIVERDAVMPSTIQSLEPLTCYVKFPGFRWAEKVKIPIVNYEDKVTPFMPNPEITIRAVLEQEEEEPENEATKQSLRDKIKAKKLQQQEDEPQKEKGEAAGDTIAAGDEDKE